MAGRPSNKPKEETIEKVEETIEVSTDKEKEELKSKNDEMSKMIEQLQAQMMLMQKQMAGTTTEPKKEKTKKVKVVNLLNMKLNLSTEGFGNGRLFQFEDYGSVVSMSANHLEDILSIGAFRKQAEEGWFYICDNDIVEEMDLSDAYEAIHDKKTIDYIATLSEDVCVDMFCGLSDTMKDSVATIMAEKINSGKPLDRNRLADIQRRTEVNVEEIARGLKEVQDRAQK